MIDTEGRHPSTVQLAVFLEPNPNLAAPLRHIAEACENLAAHIIADLDDGPELSSGLRKLLEAKDCFVRQALLDGQKDIGG